MNKEIKINSSNNGFGGLSGLLTVAFVVLKLCGVISWTWFMVFLPIIIDVVFVGIVILVVWLISRIRD